MTAAGAEPRVVSRFEANLLRILQFFLRGLPAEQAVPLITQRFARPPCLSPSAVELVQDFLAKGCVQILARAGGWRRERHLRGDRVAEGRLWQRTPPAELGLAFTGHTLDFLMRVTAGKPADLAGWGPPENELTVGDRLLLFLAFDTLRPTRVGEGLAGRPAFARNGLCRLAFAEDFATAEVGPDFAPWTGGTGAGILEAVQPVLARRWLHMERAKGAIANWQRMQTLGRSQERALQPFLAAVETAGRPDLARFLLQTAAGLLGEGVTAARWLANLTDAGPRMADRAETYRAALAVPRQLDTLRHWERRARTVGFFDEGYAGSQLWLADWEAYNGDALHARAQAVIRELDPLRGPTGAQP